MSESLRVIFDPSRPSTDATKPKEINPKTGIWFMKDWGVRCQIGFVSDARFGSDQVIKRTNRSTSRKWRALEKGR